MPKPMCQIVFLADPELVQQMAAAQLEQHISRSELMRTAIMHYLKIPLTSTPDAKNCVYCNLEVDVVVKDGPTAGCRVGDVLAHLTCYEDNDYTLPQLGK